MMIFGDPLTSATLAASRKSQVACFCRCRLGFKPKGLSWLLLSMLVAVPATPQDTEQESRNKSRHEGIAAESPKDHAGIRYKSSSRRDPFLNPLRLRKKPEHYDQEMARSLPPPGIAGTNIDELLFEGTSFRDDERRLAIVRDAHNRAYFLEEGARFFDGYLKTIQTDSIILVRETRLKSGKILTQVVTKQLRKP